MTIPTPIPEIARRLSKAQRAAVSTLGAESATIFARAQQTCAPATITMLHLVEAAQSLPDLIEQTATCPHEFRLNELGLAIRTHIITEGQP
jgi:hypothetical protein